jgi:hypothetical protein
MNDKTSATKPASPVDKSVGKVEFYQYFRSQLKAGDYSIDAAERVGLTHYGLLINRSNIEPSLLKSDIEFVTGSESS